MITYFSHCLNQHLTPCACQWMAGVNGTILAPHGWIIAEQTTDVEARLTLPALMPVHSFHNVQHQIPSNLGLIQSLREIVCTGMASASGLVSDQLCVFFMN